MWVIRTGTPALGALSPLRQPQHPEVPAARPGSTERPHGVLWPVALVRVPPGLGTGHMRNQDSRHRAIVPPSSLRFKAQNSCVRDRTVLVSLPLNIDGGPVSIMTWWPHPDNIRGDLVCSHSDQDVLNNFNNICTGKIHLRHASNGGHSVAEDRILPKRT